MPDNTNLTTTPQVWIGCLAAYNAGRLHGKWVDAIDADEMEEARAEIIRTSPADFPEESFIADYDNFGKDLAYLLGEYPRYEQVAKIGAAIEEHGEKFIAFVEACEPDLDELDSDDFYEHYRGEWDTEEEYAAEVISEFGWHNVPAEPLSAGRDPWGKEITINPIEELIPYLDMEMIARELFQHGNYVSVQRSGGIYVFEKEV